MKNWSLKFALAASLFFPLVAASAKPAPVAPENMKEYEANVGKSYHFTLTGKTSGSVWGTDVYTTDSNLSAAAVHAGVVKAGETDDVEVMVVAGLNAYVGSQRNGVASDNWSAYGASYKFVQKGADQKSTDTTAVIPKTDATQKPASSPAATGQNKPAPAGPENLTELADQTGKTFRFKVTGALFGDVFGSGPYTVDSNLATAAVHAGLVKPLAEAEVEVEMTPVSKEYKGSSANGVTTADWPEISRGFKFKKK